MSNESLKERGERRGGERGERREGEGRGEGRGEVRVRGIGGGRGERGEVLFTSGFISRKIKEVTHSCIMN